MVCGKAHFGSTWLPRRGTLNDGAQRSRAQAQFKIPCGAAIWRALKVSMFSTSMKTYQLLQVYGMDHTT